MNQFTTRMLFLVLIVTGLLLGSCKERPTISSKDGQIAQKPANQLNAGQAAPFMAAASSSPTFHGDTLSLAVHTVELTAATTHLWGYEIYTGDSLIIRQLAVPAVTGKYGFTSAAYAKKIGELVSHKLKTGQIPSVSIAELQEAGVQYKQYE